MSLEFWENTSKPSLSWWIRKRHWYTEVQLTSGTGTARLILTFPTQKKKKDELWAKHSLVLEDEYVGKRGFILPWHILLRWGVHTFRKPPKLRSIRIYQIKEAAKVGRLKNQNNPGCRWDQRQHEMKNTEKQTKTSDPSLKEQCTQVWWYTVIILALGRLWWGGRELEGSYIERPRLKNKGAQNKTEAFVPKHPQNETWSKWDSNSLDTWLVQWILKTA